ncbi:MAG: HAD-IC family P-type ATPase [Caldilineaceae bacterium]
MSIQAAGSAAAAYTSTALTRGVPAPDGGSGTVSYEVVHWINGRIRLRIPRLANDNKFAQRLGEAVMLLPAIKQARVNAHSASLVVTYQVESRKAGGRTDFGAEFGHRVANANQAILPQIVDCLRRAAGTDAVQVLTPDAQPAVASGRGDTAARDGINYIDRLGLPVLGIGLSAGLLFGLAIPGVLVGGVVLAAALPIFKRTVQGIREEKRLTVDFLDATSIVLLTVQASFLAPAVVIGIIEGSEILRDWTARRSKRASLDLLMLEEQLVLVERSGSELHVAWHEIVPGDEIVLYAGDQIPVDGTIQAGSATVEQRQLTGIPAPATFQSGDEVFAGMTVVDGYLRVVAVRTGKNTHAATVMAMAESAPAADTRVSNYARKVGNPAVLPTLAVAGGVLAVSGSVARATGIVSLDLGTGMRVSTPIAILRAQAYAEQHGILIRSGHSLEILAKADVFVFDQAALRPESAGVTSRLREMERTPLMISSDSGDIVRAAAAGLRIAPDHVYAEALPQQKVEILQRLQTDGRTVAVVGDGINDAAAMTHADVSIALGSAGDLARATADIVLLNDDLHDLLLAIAIAQQTMRVVEQNKALVITPNVVAVAYGAVAVLNPIAGVLINNGVAMVAALNSLRPLNIAQRQAVPADGQHAGAQHAGVQPPAPITRQAAGGEADAPAHESTYQAQFAA